MFKVEEHGSRGEELEALLIDAALGGAGLVMDGEAGDDSVESAVEVCSPAGAE